MKKVFNVCRNIFAVIGIIAVLFVILCCLAKPYFDFDVNITRLGMMDSYVDSLRTSGPYAKDTTNFSFRIIQNEARAQEIREYFQLDTLYAPDADTWTKAVAIGKFVSSNIPHANQREWPESVDAIGLWEYTKNVEPAFNCRLHAIFTFELLLAAGIDARYVTCMPEDALEGIPLSLREMRDHYITGEKMMMYPAFKNGSTKKDDHYAYMAKNTYWFACWGELSYYQEDYDHTDVIRDHYIDLIPSGFEPFRIGGGNTITTDANQFWAAPKE